MNYTFMPKSQITISQQRKSKEFISSKNELRPNPLLVSKESNIIRKSKSPSQANIIKMNKVISGRKSTIDKSLSKSKD